MAPARRGVRTEREVRSFEHLLLRLGTGGSSESQAYKRWLVSNVPHMSGSVPGGAEIAKAADVYLAAHRKTGADLPFFSPFDPKELHMYSIVTERNYVVYKFATEVRTTKLHVVADTRMFSTVKFDGPCFHVVLRSDGTAFEISTAELRSKEIVPMICDKMRGSVFWKSPLDLATGLGAESSSSPLEGVGFLEVKLSARRLDALASALGRPVRLMGADCTSRFKKRDPKRIPKTWKVHAAELAESMGPERGEPLDLYLVAGEDGIVGVTNVPIESLGLKTACGKKPVFSSPQQAVENHIRSRKRAGPSGEAEKESEDESVGKRLRLTAHTRVDDCCNLEVGGEQCPACVQASADFDAMRKPPIDSSRYMYNPNKSCTSVLAELKGLGLCQIFPDLEDRLAKANLASIVALDIETLNVSVSDGCKSGSRCSSLSGDRQRGGAKTLSRHVLFMMGSAAFKIKALDRWSRKGILWRTTQEALRYREFRVAATEGVPTQTDVHDCVSEWLDYLSLRRRCVEVYKRRLLEPVVALLRKMNATSDERTERDPKGRAPAFSSTIFGRLLSRLESLCVEVNVITYNGNR